MSPKPKRTTLGLVIGRAATSLLPWNRTGCLVALLVAIVISLRTSIWVGVFGATAALVLAALGTHAVLPAFEALRLRERTLTIAVLVVVFTLAYLLSLLPQLVAITLYSTVTIAAIWRLERHEDWSGDWDHWDPKHYW